MNFKQKKSLGQNFLIDDKIIPNIVSPADIKKTDTIIEVGPGLGVLTKVLIDTGAKVYTIEKDFELVEMLRRALGKNKNLTLVHQDAMFFDLSILENYKVVANLPFNIASPLIRKFLESQNPPELMVVMLQKEVAEKIVAKPGNSERGILTLAVEFYAEAKIVMIVPKNNFRPQPKVDAAILKITPYSKSHPSGAGNTKVDPGIFFKIIKAGFASKRRQIHNSLAATLRLEKDKVTNILKQAQINPQMRAEDLTLKQWLVLCHVLSLEF